MKVRAPLLVAAAVILLATAPACGEKSRGPEMGTDVEDITSNPEAHVGRTVTVSADVDDVITPASFRIAGEDIGGSGLLVFSAEGAQSLDDDDVVRVTGTVREVIYHRFKDDFGFEARHDFRAFEGEPAIAATEVTVISETGGG